MAGTDIPLYPYIPSKGAAITCTIVFTIIAAIHIYKLLKTKTWFCIPFIIGLIFEILGYLARAHGNTNRTDLRPFIVQTLLILLAPNLFAASIDMFLGRIVLATGHTKASIVRPTWLTKIFLSGDILCFLTQAVGAAMLAKTDASKATRDLGKAVVLAGLIIQLFVFAFFVVVAAVFQVRTRKVDVLKAAMAAFDWQRYLIMLYAVSGLITIRNVFRVAEFAMGENGYLLAHKWLIYIFDGLLMAFAMAICTTWYVGGIISQTAHGEAYVMMESDRHNPTESQATVMLLHVEGSRSL